jgi:predicted nucleic acid-binding protein
VPPLVVVDTNVVLDLWWFEDHQTHGLARALAGGHLRWLMTDAMQAELRDVLGRTPFARHPARCERVLASMDAWATRADAAPRHPSVHCADPDDQMFIDLAAAHRATWLFSRDRAVLELAPRLRGWNCSIVEPGAWASDGSISATGPGP